MFTIAMRLKSNPIRLSLKDENDIGSFVNELDMISTILLPPEDVLPENMVHTKAKENPYFNHRGAEDNQHQQRFASMLHNYQQVPTSEFYRFMYERDLLSSQYSSVASTIAQDKNRKKDSSPGIRSNSNSNRNFIIRQVSQKKKGKGGKNVFPKDFF